jgi:hypothetical protein
MTTAKVPHKTHADSIPGQVTENNNPQNSAIIDLE